MLKDFRLTRADAPDPRTISDMESSSINLLALISGQDPTTFILDSWAVADLPKVDGAKNPFFSDTARALWTATIAHVVSTIPDGSMADARRLLMEGYIEHADDGPAPGRAADLEEITP
ncbi:MAG: hypothetical protein RIC85_03030 [Gammaproteobacteria bacterium]